MALNIYSIIRRPVLTEKSTRLINDLHKITFLIDPEANKAQVKEALEKLFNVKVKDVNIKVRQGKNRVFKRIKSKGKLTKQAIVTLKDSQSFDTLAQLVSGGLVTSKNTATSGTETTRE
jgi:large subunit ribosomal protein L23